MIAWLGAFILFLGLTLYFLSLFCLTLFYSSTALACTITWHGTRLHFRLLNWLFFLAGAQNVLYWSNVLLECLLNRTKQTLTCKISVFTATSSGLNPSLFLLNNDGCLSRRYLRQSLCPYSEQKWHGVLPSMSLALMSAPAIKTA